MSAVSRNASDNEPRITVEAAVVRSVKGTRVGVEFLRLTSTQKEEERLRQYILNLWVTGTQEARKGRLGEPIGTR